MVLIAILVAVLGSAAVLLVKVRSALPRRLGRVDPGILDSWIEEMRSNGGKGSAIYIRTHNGTASLQLEIRELGRDGEIVLVHPEAEWSKHYFGKVRDLAISLRLPVDFTASGVPRRWPTMWIGFGSDVVAARDFVLRVLVEIYGTSPASDCRMSLLLMK